MICKQESKINFLKRKNIQLTTTQTRNLHPNLEELIALTKLENYISVSAPYFNNYQLFKATYFTLKMITPSNKITHIKKGKPAQPEILKIPGEGNTINFTTYKHNKYIKSWTDLN